MAGIPEVMMMFWCLIVMLAAAWGIVGHLQENLAKMPRPAPAQIVPPSVQTGAPQLPPPTPADDDAVTQASADGDARPYYESRERLTNLPSPLAGEGLGERETVMIIGDVLQSPDRLDRASSTETPRPGDQCFGRCE